MYIKVNETLYPATIRGRITDSEWDGRASKAITLEMTYAEANEIFVDGVAWSIVQQDEVPVFEQDENGESVQTGTEVKESEWNNSEYNLAGDITDHRDGRITVKMGKPTDLEDAYEMIYGGM